MMLQWLLRLAPCFDGYNWLEVIHGVPVLGCSLRHRPSTHQVPRMSESSTERQFFLHQRFAVKLILLPVGKGQPRDAGGECADEVWEGGGHIVGGRLLWVLGGGNHIHTSLDAGRSL